MTEEEYNEIYKEFSKNNLPERFWDNKRDTIEYVYYEDNKPQVFSNLYNALERITWAGFYYPFTCKYITSKLVNDKYEREVVVDHTHVHDFDDVVKYLYYSPESFKIAPDEEEFYSKQELKYLHQVQKYLLFIGLKDVETVHIPVARYRNKLQKKFAKVSMHRYETDTIKQIVDGKRNFVITKYYGGFREENKTYAPKEYQALVYDENGDYKLLVEYTHTEIKPYEEVKEYCNEEFKDDEKVILLYLKILEKY